MTHLRSLRSRIAAVATVGIASLALVAPAGAADRPVVRKSATIEKDVAWKAVDAAPLGRNHTSAAKSLDGGTSRLALATTAASLPSDCITVFHRALNGVLGEYLVRGSAPSGYPVGSITVTDAAGVKVTVQPRTMAFVRVLSSAPYTEQYAAVSPGGQLMFVKVVWGSSGPVVSGTIASTPAWQSVREIAGSGVGRLYALNNSGGVARYGINTSGAVTSVRSMSTAGWGTVYSLAPTGLGTYNGAVVDGFLAITEAGALHEYLFKADGTGWNGFRLRSTGWAGFVHVSAGSCSNATRPIIGVNRVGDVYAYRDLNGSNLNGSDISVVGRIGGRAHGLIFD